MDTEYRGKTRAERQAEITSEQLKMWADIFSGAMISATEAGKRMEKILSQLIGKYKEIGNDYKR